MSDAVAAPQWWDSGDVLERVLIDLLHSELRRLRPGGPPPPPAGSWRSDTRLDEGGVVGADSLELLALAAAAAELMETSGVDLLPKPTPGRWCAGLRRQRGGRPLERMVFRTSGSTGAPTRHVHCLAALDAEAACLAGIVNGTQRAPGSPGTALPVAPRRRVLSAVPLHHAYGFIHAVLLPFHLGASGAAVAVLDLRGHSPGALAALLRPGDLVLGHPLWWEAVVAAGGALPVPPDVVGVTSTAPCSPELARAVVDFGIGRLIQVYGSSETAGVGWRDGPDIPFTLLPFWRRDGQALLRNGATAAIEAPDRLDWEDDRHFRVVGRRDEAVQVGGHNVHPSRVRTILMEHPWVLDAAVRQMSAAHGGRLKAFVVPHRDAPGTEVLRRALTTHLEPKLSPPERPRAYSFGETIPRDALGKAADWVLDAEEIQI